MIKVVKIFEKFFFPLHQKLKTDADMEDLSLKERIGLTADTMLPPVAKGRYVQYIVAVAAALLLSSLPLLPIF